MGTRRSIDAQAKVPPVAPRDTFSGAVDGEDDHMHIDCTRSLEGPLYLVLRALMFAMSNRVFQIEASAVFPTNMSKGGGKVFPTNISNGDGIEVQGTLRQ